MAQAGSFLVGFDQIHRLRRKRGNEVTGNTANCLLERHEHAAFLHERTHGLLRPWHRAKHGRCINHRVVLIRITVDPLQQIADILVGIGRGAGGFVADTDEHP